MSLVESTTKKKMGRPKGSTTRREALLAVLQEHDFDPAAKLIDQFNKPGRADADKDRILLGLLPYVYMRLPQEQVISNPQALSLTINLGDTEPKPTKTIEHEDE